MKLPVLTLCILSYFAVATKGQSDDCTGFIESWNKYLKNAELRVKGIERSTVSYAKGDIESAKKTVKDWKSAADSIVTRVNGYYFSQRIMELYDFGYTMRDASHRKADRGDIIHAIQDNQPSEKFPLNCIQNLSEAHRIFHVPNQEVLDALERLKM